MERVTMKVKNIGMKLDDNKLTTNVDVGGSITVDQKEILFSFSDDRLMLLPIEGKTVIPELTKDTRSTLNTAIRSYIAGISSLQTISIWVDPNNELSTKCDIED